jgi:hypothetical protein
MGHKVVAVEYRSAALCPSACAGDARAPKHFRELGSSFRQHGMPFKPAPMAMADGEPARNATGGWPMPTPLSSRQ